MRHYAFCAAFALVLGVGAALADHAIDPEQASEDHAIQADRVPEKGPIIEAAPIAEPVPIVETEAPEAATLVSGITREVCTVSDWGVGEVRRECLTEVLPPRQSNPAAEGICMTKYGVRTCY